MIEDRVIIEGICNMLLEDKNIYPVVAGMIFLFGANLLIKDTDIGLQVHGKCIEDEYGQKCSKCGKYISVFYDPNKSDIYLYQYCPFCGTRMDGEIKEDAE